jgi:GNAT superfamily N-acetyltransferase
MTIRDLAGDDIDRLQPWIVSGLKRFGARGYGEYATATTFEDFRAALRGPAFVAAALLEAGERRAIAVLTRASWEESVLGRGVGKVFAFIADDFSVAAPIARWAVDAARYHRLSFVTATPGHAPTFAHIALEESGFRVASQAQIVHADLDAIWPAVQKIPLFGSFRHATSADAEEVGFIASHAFGDARFTGDPFLPKEWGQKLFDAWARNLVNGAADAVILAEGKGRINGFVSVSARVNERLAVPELMAVRAEMQGWGLGAMLVRKMLEWYKTAGLRALVGGTEKSNVGMNGLYHRLGFTVIDSNLVYHWVDRRLSQPRA